MKNKTNIWLGFQPGSQMDPHTFFSLFSIVLLVRPCRQFTVLTHVQNAHTRGESAGDHPSLQNTIYHTLGEHTTGRHHCCQQPSENARLRTTLDTAAVQEKWYGRFCTPAYNVQSTVQTRVFSYYLRFIQSKGSLMQLKQLWWHVAI